MTQSNTLASVSTQPVSPKKEKEYGQKTVKFYVTPSLHTERVLWYISHLHKRVWNHMQAICQGDFGHIDTVLDKVNLKGQEEIQKLKDFKESMPPIEKTFDYAGGASTTVSIKPTRPISEFGMLYALGPIRNADPELLQLPLNDLQKPCRVLAKSWKSFFELNKRGDTEARPPRMKNDLFFFTLQWEKPKVVRYGTDTVLLVNHKINGIEGIGITLPLYVSNLLSEKSTRYVTIKRTFPFWDRRSKFEVNIVYETERVETLPIDAHTKYAGVDLGARRIILIQDGMVKTWHLEKWDQYFTKQRQAIEARMATKIKGSRAHVALFDARTKLSKKWADKQKDAQRKIAYEMVQFADVFFVGETTIRLGLAKSEKGSKGQHRAVQNTGNLARFVRFLKEKAIERGKQVIEVPDFISDGDKTIRKVESAVRHLEYGLAEQKKNER
ncbi:transposase [Candidatus Nomurabacteria bacterium]|nr:transposase [Candidatus Nomurabacteria bacterium]